MAAAAVIFDGERSVAIMAGATGLSGFHLLHADLVAVGLGLKGRRVTFITAEHFHVRGMTEWNVSDIFGHHGHIDRAVMTGGAITANTKSGLSIMAGPAGLTSLHFLHSDLVAIGLGPKHPGMTVFTTKHLRVDFMTESDGPNATLDCNCLLVDKLSGMANSAILVDTESCITIVAGPTRLTLFHLLHANLVAVSLGPKHSGMTFSTAEHAGMQIVTERDSPNALGLNLQVNSLGMAGHTISRDTKGRVTIMARTAGFTGLHPLHTNLVTVCFRIKNIRMAFITAKHVGMDIMTKRNLTDGRLD